jgi:predicted peroxiredoxin
MAHMPFVLANAALAMDIDATIVLQWATVSKSHKKDMPIQCLVEVISHP